MNSLVELQALKDNLNYFRNAIAVDKSVTISSASMNIRITKKSLIDKICDLIISETQKDIEQEIKE